MKIKTGTLLSLDASTKEIGYCLWGKNKKELLDMSHFTHNEEHSLIEKGVAFENLISSIISEYPYLNEMVIEEPFQAMYGKSSSAHTTAVLNQVNAIYQYICFKAGLEVSTITVSQSRKGCFPGVKIRSLAKSVGKKEKEVCFELVRKILGDDMFPTKVLKSGKRKGLKVFEDFAGDMSDSYIVGKGFMNG